jgi:hypothetical protein
MSADEPFVGVSLERYREAAHRLLPPGITHVKPLGESSDTLPINGWQSYRFLFSFLEGDTDRMGSATFVNINQSEQMVLVTTADHDHFNEASDRAGFSCGRGTPCQPSQRRPGNNVGKVPAYCGVVRRRGLFTD